MSSLNVLDRQHSLVLSEEVVPQEIESGTKSSSLPTPMSASSSSSQSSVKSPSTQASELGPEESTQALIKQSQQLIELSSNSASNKSEIELIHKLIHKVHKLQTESDQYKMKAQLLSINAKDADMRYEVENEIIKRQVEKLKLVLQEYNDMMKKYNHQSLLIKKYKNEIIEKNKEIIRLSSMNAAAHAATGPGGSSIFKKKKKSKSFSSATVNNNKMLNTLGLLASQVLTNDQQEQERINDTNSSIALPRMNSFKHYKSTDKP